MCVWVSVCFASSSFFVLLTIYMNEWKIRCPFQYIWLKFMAQVNVEVIILTNNSMNSFSICFVFSFLCYLLPLLLLRSRSLFIYLPWTWLENNSCSLTTNIMYKLSVLMWLFGLTNSLIQHVYLYTSILTKWLKVEKKTLSWSGANSFE